MPSQNYMKTTRGFVIQGCAPEVQVMQRILMLRGLVLTPEQDIDSWLQFASMCRVNKNFRISKKVTDWIKRGEVLYSY